MCGGVDQKDLRVRLARLDHGGTVECSDLNSGELHTLKTHKTQRIDSTDTETSPAERCRTTTFPAKRCCGHVTQRKFLIK